MKLKVKAIKITSIISALVLLLDESRKTIVVFLQTLNCNRNRNPNPNPNPIHNTTQNLTLTLTVLNCIKID